VGSNDVMKLIAPGHSSLVQLHQTACEKFGALQHDRDQFVLQYMDKDFNDFINVTDVSDVSDLMCHRLCKKVANGNAEEVSNSETVNTEGCGSFWQTAWPSHEFQLPVFDVNVQWYLKEVESSFATSGNPAIMPRDIKGKTLRYIHTPHTPQLSRLSRWQRGE